MTKRHVLSCLFTCLLILYITPSYSIEVRKKAFSILIPDDWVEMPRDVIDDYLKNLAALAPNIPEQNYDYGFQSRFTNEWFEYPYILIQIDNKGRISENQLEKLEDIPVQENIDAHKNKLKAILSNVEVGKMVYDKNAGIIWMRVELDVVNSEPVSGLIGMIPTEKGFINIIGYSSRKDYEVYEPIFQTIAMTVSPEPNLLYQTRNLERLWMFVSHMDWQQVEGNAITVSLICIIIFVSLLFGIIRLKNRR